MDTTSVKHGFLWIQCGAVNTYGPRRYPTWTHKTPIWLHILQYGYISIQQRHPIGIHMDPRLPECESIWNPSGANMGPCGSNMRWCGTIWSECKPKMHSYELHVHSYEPIWAYCTIEERTKAQASRPQHQSRKMTYFVFAQSYNTFPHLWNRTMWNWTTTLQYFGPPKRRKCKH